MKKFNKWLLASGLFSLLMILSGCVQTKNNKPTGEGWVYNLLVKPMGNVITYLVHHFHWSYGLAIIALTILVRLIIMPLGFWQSHKSLLQTEKTAYFKPQIDAIQEKMKTAETNEDKMAAQMELQQFYRDNNLSMFGGMGCLPLVIQMPIFTALFYAARYTPGISKATFLGVNLGHPNLIFVVLAGLSYLLQGWAGTIGVPDEQKKMMRTMIILSPLMIVFISLSSPAGVTLYWIVGGLFSALQTALINAFHKPRIRRMIEEEMKMNPPKSVVNKPMKQAEKVKPTTSQTTKPKTIGQGRNAGKQRKR